MKNVSVLSGIVIALIISFGALFVHPVLTIVVGFAAAAKLTMAICAVSYLWMLIAIVPRRSGRLVCALLPALIELGLLFLPLSDLVFALATVIVVWLGRGALLAQRVIDAVVDAVVIGVATIAMTWMLIVTGGVWVPAWTFLLVLAARPLIRTPFSTLGKTGRIERHTGSTGGSFEEAHRTALRSLMRLAKVD